LARGAERNDRDVVGPLDRGMDFRRRAAGEFHLAPDEAHPRRRRRGATRAYARPFHGMGAATREPSCPGLTRASIQRKDFKQRRWIAGSSPAMMVDGLLPTAVILIPPAPSAPR